MSYLPKQAWAKLLVIFCYTIIGILFLYLLFSKLFAIAAPFAIAILFARLLQDPIEKLHRRLHMPKKLVGFLLNLVVILFFIFVAILIINQFITEAQNIFVRLSKNSEAIMESAASFFNSFSIDLPFIFEGEEGVLAGAATEAVKNIVSTLTAGLAELLSATVRSLPGILLFFVVFIISSFYFCMDYYGVKKKFLGLIPKRARHKCSDIERNLRSTLVKYIKAYSLILLVTFAELFVGLIVIGAEYALLVALGIALLDMLPVIGTGAVLLPWAIIEFIMGNSGFAIGLLVIFAVVSVVRELIEPKIVGECIGMHPLLTLLAMYTGYKLFGIPGILLLAPVVLIIKTTVENSEKNRKDTANDNNTTDASDSC